MFPGGPTDHDRVFVDEDAVGLAVACDVGEEGAQASVAGPVGPVLVRLGAWAKVVPGGTTDDDRVVVDEDAVRPAISIDVGEEGAAASVAGSVGPILVCLGAWAKVVSGGATDRDRVVVNEDAVGLAVACHVGKEGAQAPVAGPVGPVLVRLGAWTKVVPGGATDRDDAERRAYRWLHCAW